LESNKEKNRREFSKPTSSSPKWLKSDDEKRVYGAVTILAPDEGGAALEEA